MRRDVLIALSVVVLILHFACTSSKKSGTDGGKTSNKELFDTYDPGSVVPDTFLLPEIPVSITNTSDRERFLIEHYWDRFDFSDRGLTEKPHITEQAFVDFIHLLNFLPDNQTEEPLLMMMEKAETDTVMYRYFAGLTEKYFYDPNSPFRNEEYYIPVLNELAGSVLLRESDRSNYRFQLEMVMQNRVGDRANNFSFTLANGESRALHDVESEYLLLIFTNSGCNTCEAVIGRLSQSSPLNKALDMNSPTRTMLTILTVYPDHDVTLWKSHLSEMPKRWIHAYDRGMVLTGKRLYDIKAFPHIYLLDSNKKVILKDTSVENVESFFSING